jgi:hypothetical protein
MKRASFVRHFIRDKPDWLDVLKRCPIEIDDLPPRRREVPKRRKR